MLLQAALQPVPILNRGSNLGYTTICPQTLEPLGVKTLTLPWICYVQLVSWFLHSRVLGSGESCSVSKVAPTHLSWSMLRSGPVTHGVCRSVPCTTVVARPIVLESNCIVRLWYGMTPTSFLVVSLLTVAVCCQHNSLSSGLYYTTMGGNWRSLNGLSHASGKCQWIGVSRHVVMMECLHRFVPTGVNVGDTYRLDVIIPASFRAF